MSSDVTNPAKWKSLLIRQRLQTLRSHTDLLDSNPRPAAHAVWPQTNDLTSLSLRLVLCKN